MSRSVLICALVIFSDVHIRTVIAGEPVQVTTHDNGDLLPRNKFCLVLLYAPWDTKCDNSLGLIRKLADHFKSREDIVIASGDIYNDKKLGSKFRVDEYCSFIFMIKGSVVAERYKGPVTLDHLLSFTTRTSQTSISEEVFKRPLIRLDDNTFDRIVKDEDRDVLVLFHAFWCEKCKQLLKVLQKVALNFQNEPKCLIAEIDGEKSFDTATANDVGVYPTFRFYSKKDKDGTVVIPGKFDENWTEQNLTRLLNLRCDTNRTLEGFLDKTAGRYDELDALARYFMRNSMKRQHTVRESLQVIQKMPPYKRAKAEYYIKVMEKVIQDNEEFLGDEIQRIEKVLHSAISLDQKDEFTRKRNILHHFNTYRRDEL